MSEIRQVAQRTQAMAKAENVIREILAEFERATTMYPPMHSEAEGYAVILEEVDELWDEIRKKPQSRDHICMRREAVQVAAMALRFIADLMPERGTLTERSDTGGE